MHEKLYNRQSALKLGTKIGLLCIAVMLSACGGNTPTDSVTPQTISATLDCSIAATKAQAESKLGISFNILERKDVINGESLMVYTNSSENKTYLTVSVKAGYIGWSATRISDGQLETIGFQAPEFTTLSETSEPPQLVRTLKNLKDLTVPAGMKTYTKEIEIPSKITPQSTNCARCRTYYVVAGHYETLTVWTAVAIAAAGGAGGLACKPAGPIVEKACQGGVAYVASQVLTWVPGYSYCTQWEGLGEVCPTAKLEMHSKSFANFRRHEYDHNLA